MRDSVKLTTLAAALALGAASLATAGGGAYMGGGGGGGGGGGSRGGGGGYSGGGAGFSGGGHGGGGYSGGGGGYSRGGGYGGGAYSSGGGASPGVSYGRPPGGASAPGYAPPAGGSQSAGAYYRGSPQAAGAPGTKPYAGSIPGAGGSAGTRPAAPGYAGAPARAPGYAASPAQRSSKPLVTQGGARYSPGVAVNGSNARGSKPLVSGGTTRGYSPSTKPLVSGGSVNSMPGAGSMRGARPPSSGGWNNGNNNWHGNNNWNGNRWHGNSRGWWGPGWRGGWWGGWWGPGWGWGAGWWGPGWGWWGPTWTSWWWGPAWGLGWWGPAWNTGWWGIGVPGFSIVVPISGGTTTTIIEQPQSFGGEFAPAPAAEPEEPTEYRLYCPPSDAFQPHVQTCTQPWVKVPVPKNSQDGSRTPPADAPAGALPPGASPAPRSNGYAPQGGATTVPYAPSRQSPPRPQYETTAALDEPRAIPVSAMLANGYGEVLALGDANDASGATPTRVVSTSATPGGRIAAPRMTAPGASSTLLARGG